MRLRFLALPVILAAVAACTPSEPAGPTYPATQSYAASLGVDIATMTRVDTNLYYKDLVVGTGTVATGGKLVTITYSGYLVDGSLFENGTIGPYALDDDNFIYGWVRGIEGMKVGGKRKLAIGSNYAYGSHGKGTKIPANATLVFDIELKAVQ